MLTWEVTITPLNVDRKEANVTAVRTDGENKETHIVTALLDTQAQKLSVLDTIWASHLAYLERQAKIDAYVGDLEIQAKANLEAREV